MSGLSLMKLGQTVRTGLRSVGRSRRLRLVGRTAGQRDGLAPRGTGAQQSDAAHLFAPVGQQPGRWPSRKPRIALEAVPAFHANNGASDERQKPRTTVRVTRARSAMDAGIVREGAGAARNHARSILHDDRHSPDAWQPCGPAARSGMARCGVGFAAVGVLPACRRDDWSGAPRGRNKNGTKVAGDVGFQSAPVVRDAWPPETGLRGSG
jgi:hypothetical protein